MFYFQDFSHSFSGYSIYRLKGCELFYTGFEALASVLCSESCNLKELDLSYNTKLSLSFQTFKDGLKSPQCKLEILRSACFVLRFYFTLLC